MWKGSVPVLLICFCLFNQHQTCYALSLCFHGNSRILDILYPHHHCMWTLCHCTSRTAVHSESSQRTRACPANLGILPPQLELWSHTSTRAPWGRGAATHPPSYWQGCDRNTVTIFQEQDSNSYQSRLCCSSTFNLTEKLLTSLTNFKMGNKYTHIQLNSKCEKKPLQRMRTFLVIRHISGPCIQFRECLKL